MNKKKPLCRKSKKKIKLYYIILKIQCRQVTNAVHQMSNTKSEKPFPDKEETVSLLIYNACIHPCHISSLVTIICHVIQSCIGIQKRMEVAPFKIPYSRNVNNYRTENVVL